MAAPLSLNDLMEFIGIRSIRDQDKELSGNKQFSGLVFPMRYATWKKKYFCA